MMKVSRGSKGFTLIELLIVVAIIGILAAIAIPAYTGYTTKSRVAGVVHSMGAVKNAVLAYFTETGVMNGAQISGNGTAVTNFGGALNLDVPTQYATFTVAANTGVITATFGGAMGGGIANGDTLVLTPNTGASPWTWAWSGTGGAVQYAPKSN